VSFRVTFSGRLLKVEINHREASYTLVDGPALEKITHYGETISLETNATVTRRLPRRPARPAPRQPPGRAPARRVPQR
jgi:alpha,alpha-trehalose phosphorylase